MNPLQPFLLAVKGLKIGITEFSFILDSPFFKALNPQNKIDAKLNVEMSLDKRSRMYILDFEISGTYKAPCDRCLEGIEIPVYGEHQLYIKLGSGEDEADVAFLESFEDILDVSKYIYDYALVSFPLMNVIDCEDQVKPPCNMDMLDKWEATNTVQDDKNEQSSSSIWDALNNLNLE